MHYLYTNPNNYGVVLWDGDNFTSYPLAASTLYGGPVNSFSSLAYSDVVNMNVIPTAANSAATVIFPIFHYCVFDIGLNQ